MIEIYVAYWMGTMIESLNIPHKASFEYSEEKRNEIINLALEKNLQVMLYQISTTLIIMIDNGRFKQR